MYGFMAKLSVARLNICQILMRFSFNFGHYLAIDDRNFAFDGVKIWPV